MLARVAHMENHRRAKILGRRLITHGSKRCWQQADDDVVDDHDDDDDDESKAAYESLESTRPQSGRSLSRDHVIQAPGYIRRRVWAQSQPLAPRMAPTSLLRHPNGIPSANVTNAQRLYAYILYALLLLRQIKTGKVTVGQPTDSFVVIVIERHNAKTIFSWPALVKENLKGRDTHTHIYIYIDR